MPPILAGRARTTPRRWPWTPRAGWWWQALPTPAISPRPRAPRRPSSAAVGTPLSRASRLTVRAWSMLPISAGRTMRNSARWPWTPRAGPWWRAIPTPAISPRPRAPRRPPPAAIVTPLSRASRPTARAWSMPPISAGQAVTTPRRWPWTPRAGPWWRAILLPSITRSPMTPSIGAIIVEMMALSLNSISILARTIINPAFSRIVMIILPAVHVVFVAIFPPITAIRLRQKASAMPRIICLLSPMTTRMTARASAIFIPLSPG